MLNLTPRFVRIFTAAFLALLSYSIGMKTAIYIPDRLFEEAERFAAQRGMSRSQLYAQAVAQFIESQRALGVRERLDSVYAANPQASDLDAEVASLQERSLCANGDAAR